MEKPALSKSEQFRRNLVQRCKQRPLAPFKPNTKAPQFSKQKFQTWKAMKALVGHHRS